MPLIKAIVGGGPPQNQIHQVGTGSDQPGEADALAEGTEYRGNQQAPDQGIADPLQVIKIHPPQQQIQPNHDATEVHLWPAHL